MEKAISFRSPTFSERLKSMLGVDFYRLFHTPLFYIMVAISAIIPAMIQTMGMQDGAALYEKLNDHAYIVPGLGDAGDRIFGTK